MESNEQFREPLEGMIGIPDDAIMVLNSFRFQDIAKSNISSSVSPLTSELMSPLSTDAILVSKEHSEGYDTPEGRLERGGVRTSTEQSEQAKQEMLPRTFQCLSTLIHLAVFGIFGFLLRYILQVLFGPNCAALTSNQSALYLDLPANMVGSFLMGWFGFEFKPDISEFSELLALGLTTGFLGSLTTFSGWIQKMLDLTARGQWVTGVAGIIIGMMLAFMSLLVGMPTAKAVRWIFWKLLPNSSACFRWEFRVQHRKHHFVAFILPLIVLALLCGASIVLICLHFKSNSAKLWLACMFGPPGVWVRWLLAQLNFKGLGPKQRLKWIPLGTLIANVGAVGIMAGLSTLNLAVKTEHSKMVIEAMQIGFLGCLSTVSTMVSEIYTLYNRSPWTAFAYIALSIGLSFALGTLVYSVPVWIEGYL